MPEFSITVAKKTYKVEASSKKEAEKKIMEFITEINRKNSKKKGLKKEKLANKRKAQKSASKKETEEKKNQSKNNEKNNMSEYYMKKVMTDYRVEHIDGDYPSSRVPTGEGWEPAGGIAVAPHRGKGVLGTTGRYTWAQAWVKYEYIKTKM